MPHDPKEDGVIHEFWLDKKNASTGPTAKELREQERAHKHDLKEKGYEPKGAGDVDVQTGTPADATDAADDAESAEAQAKADAAAKSKAEATQRKGR